MYNTCSSVRSLAKECVAKTTPCVKATDAFFSIRSTSTRSEKEPQVMKYSRQEVLHSTVLFVCIRSGDTTVQCYQVGWYQRCLKATVSHYNVQLVRT